MSTTIGDVEVPFISNIDAETNVPVSEIKDVHETAPTVVQHQADSERVSIEFVISDMLDTNLSMEEQRGGIDSLTENDPSENYVNYKEWDGWFAIENVNFARPTGEPAIQEGVIDAVYLPSSDYNL